VLRGVAAGVTLMIVLAHQASGQDTLSDAAWKADIARRAAARHRVEVQRDSVAMLVDTIEVTPQQVILHRGDTLAIDRLLQGFTTVAKRRDGSVITTFRPSYLVSPHGTAVTVREGEIIAAAIGEGEVWVRATIAKGPFDESRPTTKIPLIVR
jgi:hypothetical protein